MNKDKRWMYDVLFSSKKFKIVYRIKLGVLRLYVTYGTCVSRRCLAILYGRSHPRAVTSAGSQHQDEQRHHTAPLRPIQRPHGRSHPRRVCRHRNKP